MLRNRLLIGLGTFFLAASGAWADEVGFVDCSKNAEATQVFGKPRRSTDVVASLPCGERFTILVYGFYFSRIQTRDGQVGYIYSSLIAQDRGATSLQPAASTPQTGQQAPALQTASEKTKIPRSTPFDAQPKPAPAVQPQASAQQATAVQAAPVEASSTQSAVAEVSASNAPANSSSTTSSNGAIIAAPAARQASSVVAEPQPAAQPEATKPSAAPEPVFTAPPTAPPTPNADAPEASAAVAQPNSNAATETQPEAAQPAPAQPQPAAAAPAKPAAPAIRPVDTKESWEKPRPSVRAAPLLELYGGFAFARLGGTGIGTNSIGGLGSVGWNAKSWLQVVADTSYNFETVGNTKNVLYGNHYGPRFLYRMRNRWGITPFGEALVGGSNFKTTVSGSGGYTSSTGATLSYKVGGGVDIHPSHRWEIRLIDVDYYRTAFGTSVHQTNYWISSGVVLRLFGGGSE